MRLRTILTALMFTVAGGSLVVACSAGNREGPDVTCEDLACGRINACQEGIIAQCVDGLVVRFHVCQAENICEEDWQVPGEYKCSEESTDCEGCRPERVESCDWLNPIDLLGGHGGGGGETGEGGEEPEGGGGGAVGG